jgi:hypothetical protein
MAAMASMTSRRRAARIFAGAAAIIRESSSFGGDPMSGHIPRGTTAMMSLFGLL